MKIDYFILASLVYLRWPSACIFKATICWSSSTLELLLCFCPLVWDWSLVMQRYWVIATVRVDVEISRIIEYVDNENMLNQEVSTCLDLFTCSCGVSLDASLLFIHLGQVEVGWVITCCKVIVYYSWYRPSYVSRS